MRRVVEDALSAIAELRKHKEIDSRHSCSSSGTVWVR